MKASFVASALLVLAASHASAALGQFNGQWSGSGSLQSGQANASAKFLLKIDTAPGKLLLQECWDDGSNSPIGRNCMKSSYTVENEDQIWAAGRQVGNIYPEHILVFRSNRQVAEQITIQLNSQDTLHFQYIYTNMDGASSHHSANLKKDMPH